jgi:hypothetical protein
MQSSNYRPQRRRDNEMRAIQRERREIQYPPDESQWRQEKFLTRAEARHRFSQQSRENQEYHRDIETFQTGSRDGNFYPSSQNDESDFYNYEQNREHLRYASPDFNTGYGHDANRPLPRDFVAHSDYESEKRMKELNDEDWTERDFHPERNRQNLRNDTTLRDEISHVLSQHRGIDARDIDVDVSDGIVTLTGFVPERKMRYLAEDISINCYGVIDVTNHLRVHRVSEAQARFGGRKTFPPSR